MKRFRVGSMAVGIAWVLAGICLGGATTEPATVKIENFSYEPKELTVAVGTTVTWVNEDDVPHTATGEGESPAFDSKRWIRMTSFRSRSARRGRIRITARFIRI